MTPGPRRVPGGKALPGVGYLRVRGASPGAARSLYGSVGSGCRVHAGAGSGRVLRTPDEDDGDRDDADDEDWDEDDDDWEEDEEEWEESDGDWEE